MPTAAEYVCWKCGTMLAAVPLPLSRTAECPQCRAYLHCCRLCRFYNPNVAEQCDEDRAEEVRDKTTANFCDWFKPRPDAHRPRGGVQVEKAKSKLDALFGGATPENASRSAQDKLSELFGTGKKTGK